jgi:hypothetical protein
LRSLEPGGDRRLSCPRQWRIYDIGNGIKRVIEIFFAYTADDSLTDCAGLYGDRQANAFGANSSEGWAIFRYYPSHP